MILNVLHEAMSETLGALAHSVSADCLRLMKSFLHVQPVFQGDISKEFRGDIFIEFLQIIFRVLTAVM